MDEKHTINVAELPYDQFMILGITREAVDAFPATIRRPLLEGMVTPIVQTSIETPGGMTYNVPVKLQVARDADRRLQLMTYPLRKEVENTLHLNEADLQKALHGGVIRIETTLRDGKKGHRYVQLDPETKSFMYRDMKPANEQGEKLDMPDSVKDITLGQQQKDAIRGGKPVELTVGDQKVTVGIDLREPKGFKVVNGDMDEWKRQQAIRYDDAHPEYVGYVQTDENRWEYKQLVLQQEQQKQLQQEKRQEIKQKMQHANKKKHGMHL